MNGVERTIVVVALLAAIVLLSLAGVLDGDHAARLLETVGGGVGFGAVGYVAGRHKA